MPHAEQTGKPLGRILVARGCCKDAEIETALRRQRREGGRLGEILVATGVVTESELAHALAVQHGMPCLAEALAEAADAELVSRFPRAFLTRNKVLPLQIEHGRLRVAAADPLRGEVIDDLARMTGLTPEIVVAPAGALVEAIRTVHRADELDASKAIKEIRQDEHAAVWKGAADAEELLEPTEGAPAIRLVNLLFTQALADRASDIHVEPYEKTVRVRFRVDGVLHDAHVLPKGFHPPLISRIKVLSDLDIAERRLPQDGRIRLRSERSDVDVRVSITPSAHGERAVLRLLPQEKVLPGLGELGLQADDEKRLRELIQVPDGLVLVTGPTGSGKTTTLYALLQILNDGARNILTVEDPIEYQVEGVGQMQVNPKIGLTFASGLRSILRQDPDVILVGEIRDAETATIAVQSALTGHLVLSTLHTNDAPSAVTRLVDMGVEPYLVASTMRAVLAQRLVRRICGTCGQWRAADAAERATLGRHGAGGASRVREGRGCEACLSTGYQGRSGLFELLVSDAAVRRLIAAGRGEDEVWSAARQAGVRDLEEDGLEKVITGATTVKEVLRVARRGEAPAPSTGIEG
ncbi:MAG: Flp pilus assembly complex ATPase component TadA [Candidatus Schekmanbacteria bacterium]|nr:Flp pilus assembly complex ATPase component TadA [Candidatus Schekmanbacteria bacterium]